MGRTGCAPATGAASPGLPRATPASASASPSPARRRSALPRPRFSARTPRTGTGT
ncbi:hypothetical protein NSERUTF1_5714 [Nocardia seriolae]|nr:hypothetical protein NSERUTF1_5714 [Nocardia seriolae]